MKLEIRMEQGMHILATVSIPLRFDYIFKTYGVCDILYRTDRVRHVAQLKTYIRLFETYITMLDDHHTNTAEFYQARKLLKNVTNYIFRYPNADLVAVIIKEKS